VTEFGERTREAVAEVIRRAEPGPALEQAKKIDDLARYIGEQEGQDFYGELVGDDEVDASFIRTVAAEEAERRGWDLDVLMKVLLILADFGLLLLGGATNDAIVNASFTAAGALIGELA
jgi:hypothetical protein